MGGLRSGADARARGIVEHVARHLTEDEASVIAVALERLRADAE